MVRSRRYAVHCIGRDHARIAVPSMGALPFTGDRNWDKGFLDALLKERGAVDVVGLSRFSFGDGDRVGGTRGDAFFM